MKELLPGLFHWRVTHPDIHIGVDSYFIAALQPVCLSYRSAPAQGGHCLVQRAPDPCEHIFH